ncbi:glycosyltransferase family 2 protein [Proteus mirabilis]|uniref:glycosyltransferase family 2 protein n=1 Tax=Proteus mirabilis TaxID=584 RepID=UPI00257636C9|nr:glycosyltransferase family 2 protein [Proteus mirabilis]MDM3586029.1 glycosyltransferase family 2 protein [Proteus mirabilis]MDM3831663.1 glycosyltransferase family 2 protein [Proteus mirabilis]MEC4045874.1 glycosyltransferase family 2 protein [Proteus mirabilis]
MKKEKVSICVITYNSSNTILSTLNSILCQDYGTENIELIISDDGSKDNTCTIIEEWSKYYSTIFYKFILIKNNINSGISFNVNQAWKSTNCNWIKTIAGDDILDEKCITSNIMFINNNSEVKILFSKMQSFYEKNNVKLYQDIYPKDTNILFFKKTASEQFEYLLTKSFNIAPSSFIHKDILIDVDYADERFKCIEDLPLWLKITKKGYRLHFNPQLTVYYRISDSLSNSVTRFININFHKEILLLHKKIIKPNIKGLNRIYYFDKIFELKSNLIIAKMTKNKKNKTSYILNKLISLFRPRWYHSILKRFIK